MKKNEVAEFKKYLFIMPLDHPFQLTADYQYQTAQILSQKHGCSVLAYQAFTNQIRPWKLIFKTGRKEELFQQLGIILIVNPIHFLPFERFQLIYRINKKLSFLFWVIFAQIYFKKNALMLWVFHPRFYWMAKIIKKFSSKPKILYDCLDYISSINISEEKLLRKGEKFLFKESDLVIYNSQFLSDFHLQYSSKFLVSPSGFVVPPKNVLKKTTHTKEKKKIIGFGGSINYRIDYDLMKEICEKLPQYQFKFYGERYTAEEDEILKVKNKMDVFFRLPNVQLIQYMPRNKLYEEMVNWNVGIIPYNLKIPLNFYCKPLKLYEYFYFGLPVISKPIPSILEYDKVVYFADSVEDWIKSINKALTNKEKTKVLSYKRNEALKNSWSKKIDFIFKEFNKIR